MYYIKHSFRLLYYILYYHLLSKENYSFFYFLLFLIWNNVLLILLLIIQNRIKKNLENKYLFLKLHSYEYFFFFFFLSKNNLSNNSELWIFIPMHEVTWNIKIYPRFSKIFYLNWSSMLQYTHTYIKANIQ